MNSEQIEGQLSIFDMNTEFMDKTFDRNGKQQKQVPSWMHYERCENCTRWVRYSVNEQPPCGWGIYGFCNEHKQRTEKTSYCNKFEDKNRP